MSNNEALISIIVPVYNVESFLARCVKSIQAQTYANFELILIDDGSTDTSGKICDGFASRDHRIRVMHKENSGPSIARNSGIDIARGEYILFVDSDDFIGPSHIENLMKAASEAGLDPCLTVTGLTEISIHDSLSICESVTQYKTTSLNQDDALCELVSLNGRFASQPCGKLFPRKLFDQLRFPAGKYYEDQFVIYKVFLNSETIIYEDSNDYYYVIDRGQSTTNSSKVYRLDFLEAIRSMKDDPDLSHEPVRTAVYTRYIVALADACMIAAKYGTAEQFQAIYAELRAKSDSNKFKDLNIPLKAQLVLVLSRLGMKLFYRVARVVYR